MKSPSPKLRPKSAALCIALNTGCDQAWPNPADWSPCFSRRRISAVSHAAAVARSGRWSSAIFQSETRDPKLVAVRNPPGPSVDLVSFDAGCQLNETGRASVRREAPSAVTAASHRVSPVEAPPLEVIVVGHEATVTGAPLQLLALMQYWKATDAARPTLVLRRGGPLRDAYRECTTLVELTPKRLRPVRKLAHEANAIKHYETVATRIALLRHKLPAQSVVYSNTLTNASVTSALRRRGHPVVLHAHELRRAALANVDEGDLRACARAASSLIANSRATAKDLAEIAGSPVEDIVVIPPFLTRSTLTRSPGLRAELGIDSSARLVMGCGALTELKGVDVFVEVARLIGLNPGAPEVVFVWVGDGPGKQALETWRRAIKARGLEHLVRFIGPLADPRNLMVEADLLAFLSREDGFGVVNLEAASVSVPVVCVAGSGGAQEFVGAGAGVVVPTRRPDQIASVILALLADDSRRARLGRAGQALVADRFNIQKASSLILEQLRAARPSAHRPSG